MNNMHKLLHRQLSRLNLNPDSLPTDINKWQELLQRVNQAYLDADQEKYLLERSMEISSSEMKDLNTKLEESQHIAGMGYWFHNKETQKNIWSKELYNMFKLEFDKSVPTLEEIFTLIHEEDREKIRKLVKKAFSNGENYEAELRMKSVKGDGDYRWYYVIGRPKFEQDKPITELAGITMDITNRKTAEEKVSSLQQQLVSSARRAGMAEVATSILHNVGNVLNSVNVSINMISEYIKHSDVNKLLMAERLLIEHKNDLGNYITKDVRGKLIPQYLVTFTENLQSNYDKVKAELQNLIEQVGHIKAITEMQKSLSGVSGIVEKVYVPESIDSALKMCGKDIGKNDINILKNYENTPFIPTDNSKLIQILVNLISNARDAFIKHKVTNKQITISIKKTNDDFVMIQVKDNGVGIASENLIKIFSFGFTTKVTGHGFGLHSSALAAKELGGSLEAKSDGIGHGACFELKLPLKHQEGRVANESEPELTTDRH